MHNTWPCVLGCCLTLLSALRQCVSDIQGPPEQAFPEENLPVKSAKINWTERHILHTISLILHTIKPRTFLAFDLIVFPVDSVPVMKSWGILLSLPHLGLSTTSVLDGTHGPLPVSERAAVRVAWNSSILGFCTLKLSCLIPSEETLRCTWKTTLWS